MAILLCHNLKSKLRIYRSPPQESEFWRKNNFFKLVQNLLASVPYFYQDNGCALAIARATPTFATSAIGSHPKLYALKMLDMIILALLLTISSLLTWGLIMLPVDIFGWLHFPNWLSLILIVLAISWCLDD
ncbi:MAG: hypothetical protein LH628_20495 [Microcoleus sp. CAN_BIN18]|nr:hypothetical protein [Microcoleus sp. CAN_BIN18]